VYTYIETPKIAWDKTEKQKLTLGIERGIIDKAKAAGINISAITEHLLRSITYDPKGDTTEDVANAYQALFNATWPLLDKYDATLGVGADVDHNAVLKISSEACIFKFVFLIYAPLAGEGRRPSAFPVNEELSTIPLRAKTHIAKPNFGSVRGRQEKQRKSQRARLCITSCPSLVR
jgi:hypothetical protein